MESKSRNLQAELGLVRGRCGLCFQEEPAVYDFVGEEDNAGYGFLGEQDGMVFEIDRDMPCGVVFQFGEENYSEVFGCESFVDARVGR